MFGDFLGCRRVQTKQARKRRNEGDPSRRRLLNTVRVVKTRARHHDARKVSTLLEKSQDQRDAGNCMSRQARQPAVFFLRRTSPGTGPPPHGFKTEMLRVCTEVWTGGDYVWRVVGKKEDKEDGRRTTARCPVWTAEQQGRQVNRKKTSKTTKYGGLDRKTGLDKSTSTTAGKSTTLHTVHSPHHASSCGASSRFSGSFFVCQRKVKTGVDGPVGSCRFPPLPNRYFESTPGSMGKRALTKQLGKWRRQAAPRQSQTNPRRTRQK